MPVLEEKSMRALVLSGGANRGAVEAGAILALFERGIFPDLVVGASVGAINATYIACQPSLEGAKNLCELWLGISRENVFPGDIFRRFFLLLSKRDRIYPNDRLRQFLTKRVPCRTFEKTAIPLCVVATSLDKGEEVVLDSGNLIEAILASCAIPGVFPPVEIDGIRYVDGGVTDNVPISVAVEKGADTIYVINVGWINEREKMIRNVFDITVASFNALQRKKFMTELEHYRAKARIVHMHPRCRCDACDISFSNFSKSSQMIEHAYSTTLTLLDSWESEANQPLNAKSSG